MEIWILQCRNDDMIHALIHIYTDRKRAFAEERRYKEKYKYVALESYEIGEKHG